MASTLPVDPTRPRRASGQGFCPGAVLAGRYRIETYLAAGSMGHVYRAQDITLDAPLAVKTIRPEIASDPASLRRFKQEVLLARSVTHPNVCRIFDIGEDVTTGVTFLTMELLAGETLAARIKKSGALTPAACLPLVRQMAAALDAAHRAGIVHRDFKSPNVMLVPTDNGDRVVITDFGLAMAVAAGTASVPGADRATQTTEPADRAEDPATRSKVGGIVGTPAYMSPEQVTGKPLGPASDLYALGVVLFEMCTGELPFRGATALEIARAHVTMPPPSPSKLVLLDDAWEQTILTLLAKDPAKRYATALDAVRALEGRRHEPEAVQHSLPAERDTFVGRVAELGALASHLEGSGGVVAGRLLTLLGPGGTGKTRLAQKYGWESLARWPGGVWFCDLSEARSVDGIAQAVAGAMNLPLGKEDPVMQLGHAIAGRGQSLVILDNFEQVIGYADATLGRWLARSRDTRFLVTSRERLQLPGEMTHVLEPLDPTTQGVELFEVRAQGHRPAFRVDASNLKQVEEIVQRLDGLPLAIELGAARLRMLSLGQLHDRLAERFKILAGGKRGRHATLQTTLDWSWQLLEPSERSAITQLSVFEGGFTLEAAEVVIDLSAHDEAPLALDVIQSLVDKSWLRQKVALQAPRFEMYSTVQEYASAKLRANLELLSAAEARHGAYFAEMGRESFLGRLSCHGGGAAQAALLLELDNLTAACRRALACKDETTAVAAYAAAGAVLMRRGPFATSIHLGREVLGMVEDRRQRGRALLVLAEAEAISGEMEEAREHYEAALTIHREAGSRHSEGIALRALGGLHYMQGRMEEAREHFETALAIHREVGDRRSEGIVLTDLADIDYMQGRVEEGREHYERGLAIHREVGDRRSEGSTLGNLGNIHMNQGRIEEAQEHYEAALAITRELGDRVRGGVVVWLLGNIHMNLGRMAEARDCYKAALAIHREVGNRRFEGVALGKLGVLHHQQGRMEEAREYYDAALAIHREVGHRRFEGVMLGNLGILHMEQGRMEEARGNFEAALAIDRAVDNRHSEGMVLGNLGELNCAQGQLEEARRCFEESIVILRDLGERAELGKVLCSLGRCEIQQDERSAASAALAEAQLIADTLAVTPESQLARQIEQLWHMLATET